MVPSVTFIVNGEIRFRQVGAPVSQADIYVRLIDGGLADAPSKVVAEEVIRNVSIDPSVDPKAQTPIAFSFQTSDLTAGGVYTLTVHVDANGSGEISLGDYLTMESFPVVLSEPEVTITARVHPVH